MSEKQVIKHCAPTLAGLKSGSMFSCRAQSKEEILHELRRYNRLLRPKGIRFILLRLSQGRALIYLYRITHLRRALANRLARRHLAALGYPVDNVGACVAKLAARIRASQEFPHEVGFFLGYPPEDVLGFIRDGSRACKAVGHWKVYGDEEAARRRFAQLNKCTAAYTALFASGKTLERLCVAS